MNAGMGKASSVLAEPANAASADALADIAAGKFVVVTDDADRENEGDLIMAAQHMTPEKMHFMVCRPHEARSWQSSGARGEARGELQVCLRVSVLELLARLRV